MNDERIIAALRAVRPPRVPTALADLLDALTEGQLSQGTMVTYFKRAFPSIPLRILLEAGAWSRVSGGELSDADFNRLLAPWVERAEHP